MFLRRVKGCQALARQPSRCRSSVSLRSLPTVGIVSGVPQAEWVAKSEYPASFMVLDGRSTHVARIADPALSSSRFAKRKTKSCRLRHALSIGQTDFADDAAASWRTTWKLATGFRVWVRFFNNLAVVRNAHAVLGHLQIPQKCGERGRSRRSLAVDFRLRRCT